HQGGKRTEVGSPEYEILRRWIAGGALLDAVEPSRITQLRVTPAQQIAKPGETFQLRVEATFADRTVEDVTALCSYESLDRQVATVESDGRVQARGVGDAALIVRYRAEPALALVAVPRDAKEPFPDVPAQNFIDGHIVAKLRRLNLPPTPLADDSTFLRRVSLDVAGEVPTPAGIRALAARPTAPKGGRQIDELRQRAGHAAPGGRAVSA